jgi:hypothetical protein
MGAGNDGVYATSDNINSFSVSESDVTTLRWASTKENVLDATSTSSSGGCLYQMPHDYSHDLIDQKVEVCVWLVGWPAIVLFYFQFQF